MQFLPPSHGPSSVAAEDNRGARTATAIRQSVYVILSCTTHKFARIHVCSKLAAKCRWLMAAVANLSNCLFVQYCGIQRRLLKELGRTRHY